MSIVLSCGLVILSETGEILLAHATHAPQWDIPKGCADDGESPLDAAVRETREESGLNFEHAPLSELGRFAYRPRKDLHLFAVKLPAAAVEPALCRCSTVFTGRNGGRFPEVDAFRWVPFDQVSRLCTARMAMVLLEDVNVSALHDGLPLFLGTVQRVQPARSSPAD
ncbi:MAG TPA: NUDIX hydrolase [Burkholderiaceae bacterium]|nr:NUDIX hydrolase [Burkholderiaceae bacterium]